MLGVSVGPRWHEQLIRLLACVVALDLTAGVVVISARHNTAPAASAAAGREAPAAGQRPSGTGNTTVQGGILAGGQFTNRRGSGGSSSPTTGASPTPATATPGGSSGGSPAATTSTGPSGRPGATTGGASGPTTTTRPGATSSTAAPTTATTRPTTTTTTPPVTGTPGGPGPSGDGGATGATGPSHPGFGFADRTGDTVVENTGNTRVERRADIVQSQAQYSQKAIVLAVKVDDSADPRQDPHWSSGSSYVGWEIDSTGDGKPDFEVQFFLENGQPAGGVSRVGDSDGASVCGVEAGYSQDGYLAVGFESSCLGNPASFTYKVSTYYDTDPANENAEVVTDTGPDTGLSKPVARPQ